MSAHPSLAPLLESFFRNRLAKQRNASPATITSYRDALRMLILFAAEQTGRKPCALAVEDLDRDLFSRSWTRSRRSGRTRSRHAMRVSRRSGRSSTMWRRAIPRRSVLRSVCSLSPSRSRTPR